MLLQRNMSVTEAPASEPATNDDEYKLLNDKLPLYAFIARAFVTQVNNICVTKGIPRTGCGLTFRDSKPKPQSFASNPPVSRLVATGRCGGNPSNS